MKLEEINLYRVRSPLTVPCKVSYRTFDDFEPSNVEVRDAACVAAATIDDAGEFNGFLKAKRSLLANPMTFEKGDSVLPAGYTPEVDRDVLAAHTIASGRYRASVAPVRAAE